MMKKLLVIVCAGMWSLGAAQSHEFWIEPAAFQLQTGESVALDLKVGMMLEGRPYPFLSHKFLRYDTTTLGATEKLTGREGDLPSVTFTPAEAGLHVIAYQATAETLVYDDFARFVDYVQEEGLPELINRHHARGLPDTGFAESYVRNVKALVQVDKAQADQRDTVVGLPFELVALENPFLGQKTLPVKLLWQGNPLPRHQIALFRRHPAGTVSRTVFRTDDAGIATLPVIGQGVFLLSAVLIEETDIKGGPVWHSTWAGLTFGRRD